MFNKLKNEFPENAVLACSITGGGISFFDRLIGQGGASRFFVFGEIPYSQDFQFPGIKSVSDEMAMKLASRMYWEVRNSDPTKNNICAVGASFSLMKVEVERESRLNQGYIFLHLGKPGFGYNVVFNKVILDTREKQEAASAEIIAQLIYKHAVDSDYKPKVEGIYFVN